jgi:hypothetical protein
MHTYICIYVYKPITLCALPCTLCFMRVCTYINICTHTWWTCKHTYHIYTCAYIYQPMMLSLGGERIPAHGIPGEMDAIVSNLGTLRFRYAPPFPRDLFAVVPRDLLSHCRTWPVVPLSHVTCCPTVTRDLFSHCATWPVVPLSHVFIFCCSTWLFSIVHVPINIVCCSGDLFPTSCENVHNTHIHI